MWPSRGTGDGAIAADAINKLSEDVADMGITDSGAGAGAGAGSGPDPPRGRPLLTRNQQSYAPPPPPPNQNPSSSSTPMTVQQATDSLSILQLRRLVEGGAPQTDPIAYDFTYTDMAPHGEEIDEWFGYLGWQRMRLNAVRGTFEWQWQEDFGSERKWEDVSHRDKEGFVAKAVAGLSARDVSERSTHVGKIAYLVLGRWGDTAVQTASPDEKKVKCVASAFQLEAINEGVKLLTSAGGLPGIWRALRNCFEVLWSDGLTLSQTELQMTQEELLDLMTILYISIQTTLNDVAEMADTRKNLLSLTPSLPNFLLLATSKLRWDDGGILPQAQIFLLLWKSILLVFGGTKELADVKKATSETPDDGKEKDIITASPLDYHAFRQEITSKYPAYIPPPCAIPLEAENTSLLPPLPNQSARGGTSGGVFPAPPNAHSGASILHQPVHIATPAPSPPPSPAAGKGGKKQNYQTNQNFPFLYPPLDATSNSAGGKGLWGVQGQLISRRWEGSDIPASILEAGEIFSRRVRMTRATRQLWEERETFIKFDRGWSPNVDQGDDEDEDDIEELYLDELSEEERKEIEALRKGRKEKPPAPDKVVDLGPHEDLSDEVKRQLTAIEDLYRESLPNLQSLVIVLLKAILHIVTVIIAQAAAAQQQGASNRGPNGNVNGAQGGNRQADGPNSGTNNSPVPELSVEDLDAARTMEITAKAATGTILLLLKWFKISHVLKFEYLTQLLLDSNYIPLILKLFAHQDIQQVVDSKTDSIERSFFYFCNRRSRSKEPSEPAEAKPEPETASIPEEDSEDDALPPPIKRRRSPPSQPPTAQDGGSANPGGDGPDGNSDSHVNARPEVDELGYPVTDLPKEPITDFSWRNFFTMINSLRIMQKVCKGKAHRNLLLVTYKSSTILRKSLRIPQPELRLYTLKLFKNQVPYCGRKWRQGNMRVITAVYLHCRPELRDEWLAGSDVDAEVDSAVPLEQALRGLTHWFNVRRYPEGVAPGVRTRVREEQDFFAREVERLEVAWVEEGEGGEWEADAGAGPLGY